MRVLALLPLLLGCAWDAGHGFGTVEAATLEGHFEPGPARAIDGGFLTDLGYRITLDELAVETEELGLDSLASSGGGETFDPAHPPPGYTLCHGGHCHAEDGSLVSYAEIEAELSGGGGFVRVVTFGGAGVLDLLAPEVRALSEGTPSSELPRTTLRRAVVRVRSFELAGEVISAELSPRPLRVTLASELDLDAPFDLTVDEEGIGKVALDATLVLDGTLFDGVDFDILSDVELETSTGDGVVGSAVFEALSAAEVSVRMTERQGS